jgi:hypothetical protein
VRLQAEGPAMSTLRQENAYRPGAELTLPPLPLGPDRVIIVEGLDSERVALAQGQSAPFAVTAEEPRQLIILFQRCIHEYYLDADKDGFGSTPLTKVACAAPPGYVETPEDCDDANPEVNPGQTNYFVQASGSIMGYDYNCSGKEEKHFLSLINCTTAGPSCKAQGWVDQVPDCGQSGTFIACEKVSSICGPGPAQEQQQACQ